MKAFLFLLAFCSAVTGSYGQELIKSIGNTAKEKANARDFNTTRNNRERGNLQQEKNRSLKESESTPAPASAPAPGSGNTQTETPAEPSGDYQASYTFSSSVTYQMETPAKANELQEIHYSFGDQVIKIGAANQDMSSIIDSKNGVMIMLNNTNKTATVMSAKMMEMAMQQQTMSKGVTERPATKVTKTGRIKTILGYKCEEIIIEADKKTEVWVTNEAGIDVSNVFAGMAKTSMSQIPSEAFSGGVLMEMTSYTIDSKPEMHMLMVALSKETKVVNIGAYKITKL